jgi:aryl-alcohol dehydrogenase-like predicted oxidoreductase
MAVRWMVYVYYSCNALADLNCLQLDVRLGTSGLKISKIVLGCMSYGNDAWSGGWTLKGDEALEHFGEAFKMGINTYVLQAESRRLGLFKPFTLRSSFSRVHLRWDTANMYSNGDSEILVGQAIKKFKIPREELVILSKVWGLVAKVPDTHPSKLADPDNNGYVNLHGLSRKAIFASVRDSLKRMDIEYIDLYQCHRFDPETPISETMHALHDIVKLGLVRYIGMSSCYAYQVRFILRPGFFRVV